MHRPVFLFLLSSFYAGISLSNDAVWNCEQNKENKEWVCVGDKKPAEQIPKPYLQEKTETAPAAEPALSESEEKIPLPKPEPALAQPLESSQPTVAESDENVKPVIAATHKPAPDHLKAGDAGRRPGWTCNPGEQSKDWNCNLVGADPKGEARIMATDEKLFSLLDPAFDYKQEQIFNTLSSQLKYDPWANCSVEMSAKPEFVSGRRLRAVAPLEVKSNYGEVFDNEIGSYSGNVEISRSDQHSLSNAANYDSISETLDLHGEVYYSEDELALYSSSATLKLASDQARLRDVMFITPSTPIRGRAKAVYRENKYLSRYKDVAYTSCPPNKQDWVVHASDLKLNDQTGKGAAKNAWLEFKGLPVFYSPYLSFPMDNRRISGFLAPSFGSTQLSGFNISVPYYWNIAPNYDATLRPRYLTDRGALLAGDFRLLTKYSNSTVSLEYMPDDRIREQSRFLGSIRNTSNFTSNLSSNLDLNYVSDKEYFGELGTALSFPNFSHVKSTADLNYKDEGVSFVSRIENYQTIDKTLTGFLRPYRRLPQVNLGLNHAFDFMPLYTALESEYVYFQHNSIVNGQRFNIKPSVSLPWRTEAAYLTPKLSVQHTDYQLGNLNAGQPDSVSRTLPIASLDGGLFFERELGKSALTHTLEPRLFYLYIPNTDQSTIPLFDTSLYDFWYNSLFRENRFSGTDRIQDANQVTAALTSRLIDPATGKERLKLSVGEIFYFRDREVTAPVRIPNLPGWINLESTNGYLESPPETSSLSPLVAELGSEFSEYWSANTGLQWDPGTNEIVRGMAALHFIDEAQKIVNFALLYRRNPFIEKTLENNLELLKDPIINPTGQDPLTLLTDSRITRSNDIIQSDMSFRWPLYDTWYAVGRWQYSWLYNQTQETFLGLEKENCCWRFQVIGRRWINNINSVNNPTNTLAPIAEGVSQTGIFFQLELKGLTGIGQKLDQFFEESIYGYRKPEKK
jgi:LPS-assembly protein